MTIKSINHKAIVWYLILCKKMIKKVELKTSAVTEINVIKWKQMTKQYSPFKSRQFKTWPSIDYIWSQSYDVYVLSLTVT